MDWVTVYDDDDVDGGVEEDAVDAVLLSDALQEVFYIFPPFSTLYRFIVRTTSSDTQCGTNPGCEFNRNT